jgi:hypothetical protein
MLIIKQDFFRSLAEEGLFNSCLHDQIALFAIFIPILRAEIFSFVRTWNSHYIRKQKNRSHVVHGKPYMNYHHPPEGVYDHGIPVDSHLREELQKDVKEFGIISDLSTSYKVR